MSDRYDPHRAHPDTVLALLEWHVAPDSWPRPPVEPIVAALRAQCRIDPDADLLRAAKAYFVKFFQPGDVNAEWAELERAGRLAVLATAAPPAVVAPGPDSGPPGAAAKESREDIAAPGGATTEGDPVAPEPGERPCGCEETEELVKQLAALRARNFELAMVLSRVRKLINEPWKP